MHLFGFITRIYRDARFFECQIRTVYTSLSVRIRSLDLICIRRAQRYIIFISEKGLQDLI